VGEAADIAREGEWLIAAWHGEIDMSNARTLEHETLEALRNSDVGLTVDLSEVGYIDSAGIRSLLTIRRLLQERQQQLHLVIPEDSVINKALEVGGVVSAIPVHRSIAGSRETR
jgi:anti-anti-sigma factor